MRQHLGVSGVYPRLIAAGPADSGPQVVGDNQRRNAGEVLEGVDVGTDPRGKSRCSRMKSSQSGGKGQLSPASSARRTYSATVERAKPRLAAACRDVSPSPHLSRRTSLVFLIGNLLAGIFASFLGYRKAKDTRFSRDYPASLNNFPSHSGHLSDDRPKSGRFPVGMGGRLRSEWWPLSVGIPGRIPSEYAFDSQSKS